MNGLDWPLDRFICKNTNFPRLKLLDICKPILYLKNILRIKQRIADKEKYLYKI